MIDADRLDRIFTDCLFGPVKPATDGPSVVGNGIMCNFEFHRGRLASHAADINEMLSQLPDQFFRGKGGGWSFLNMGVTKDGDPWGEHPAMEQLMALGNALGAVNFLFPREKWHILPGGMPYIVINPQE